MKPKTRSFSIFLLKEGVTADGALKQEHSLEVVSDAENLPAGAALYISDKVPLPPWWRSYWGIKKDLKQAFKGAIAFIPVADRIFALTFGHTYHNLREGCYEYDFGLRTTLNALDPEKIKSTDILVPESAFRERIQSPTASDLTFFDFDRDESIVKKLTGSVKKEYEDYFKNVTGSSSLKISAKVSASEISRLCERLLDTYKKDDFKNSFPDIQNIVPMSDPQVVEALNAELMKAFKVSTTELVLAIPDIIDYGESFKISYSGAGRVSQKYDEFYIDHYRAYLKERKVEASIEALKSHKLEVRDENWNIKEAFSVFKGLLFDCSLEANHYHLCEGEWYKIEKNYINKLKNELDPIFVDCAELVACEVRREDEYNQAIVKALGGAVCLDKKNIAPAGQAQVEPCDVFLTKGERHQLIHIKVSTRSSSLSHLFNQGLSSAKILRMFEDSVEKLKKLIAEGGHTEKFDVAKIEVVYGIITAKEKSKKSDSLPIFSRISLSRAIKSLRLMSISGSVALIEDKFERKAVVD